jgi:hypothetical protein
MHRHEISLGKILGIPLFERQSIQRVTQQLPLSFLLSVHSGTMPH